MKLNKQWRVLTVGDGDLSFSNALSMQFPASQLTASIYDTKETLLDKYEQNAYHALIEKQVPVMCSFDVTDPDSWLRLPNKSFDAVIFQFPLIPAFSDFSEFQQQPLSVNTLNRRLLRLYIYYAHKYALAPHGPMLCFITSKDVKPYCEWDIESSLSMGLDIKYLGQSDFDINDFPGYKIRNVDRDKHVKDTSGISYVWSAKSTRNELPYLKVPHYLSDSYCSFCRAGPFMTEKDKLAHANSKKHKSMTKHHNDWLNYLSTETLT
tara:strand:- start:1641 stop:2435 length:795 start_codon:yes stop_codon:yes gene_type:complete